MIHAMIDIETLSTSTNAVIVSIGAVPFNFETEEVYRDSEFYTNVSAASCMKSGLDVNASTVVWWMEQPDEVRLPVFGREARPGKTLYSALLHLSEWYADVGADTVWARGSDFDIAILRTAYDAVNLDPPWDFWKVRDLRTLEDLAGGAAYLPPRTGVTHNALDDAVYQAECAIVLERRLQNLCKL